MSDDISIVDEVAISYKPQITRQEAMSQRNAVLWEQVKQYVAENMHKHPHGEAFLRIEYIDGELVYTPIEAGDVMIDE